MLKKWLIKTVFLGTLLVVAIGSLWIWGALNYTYSSGDRAGYVQKFSKKGWLIKTWEGELAMVNLPGAMPEIFHFSVRDPEAVEQIRASLGRRVVLEYEERRFLPPHIFGDTNYFVSSVKTVEGAPAPSHSPSSI